MAEDSILSWIIVTALAYYGIFRLIIGRIHEEERRKKESERCWQIEQNSFNR